jgi:diguanylate cyclase (GGDEF)-like protein
MREPNEEVLTVESMRDRVSWTFLGLGVLTCLAYLLLRSGAAEPVAYLVAAAVGVAMSIVGACLIRGPRRKVWVALAAGQVLYVAGDVLWVIYESVLHISPYPSLADAFYLTRYVLLTLGLMWLIRGRRRGRDRAAFLDAAIISTGFAVLGAVFVIAPVAASGGESLFSQVLAGAYPIGDLLLLAALVRLFTSGAARNLSFWSLAGGLAVTMVVDIQYVLSVVSGVWFPDWVNVGWLVGYLFIGFGALHPSVDHLSHPTPDRPERLTSARLVALGLALALAPLTELLARITGVKANPFIVVTGALVGTVLVLARMAGLLGALQAQAVQLAALARNDGLTGVANRRTWDHELSRACAAARENDLPLTVALLDLDHFKAFNDSHGHVKGDLVLKETAEAWGQLLDGQGFLARYGGEEFTVLLPNTSTDLAESMLDQLREAVSQGQTCSIGLTVWDGHEDPDHLVSRADEALYHAKRSGRNRMAVHDGERVRDSVDRYPDPLSASARIEAIPVEDLETGMKIG